MTDTSGIDSFQDEPSYNAQWIDIDNDDLLDLYIARGNQASHLQTELYKNLGGGKFKNLSATAFPGRTPEYNGHICWGDYDRDGLIDLYENHFDRGYASLWHNNGDYTFTDKKTITVNTGNYSTGCVWSDFDSNGYVDILQSTQAGSGTFEIRNDSGKAFSQVNLFTNTGQGHVLLATDLNLDGEPDYYVGNIHSKDLCFVSSPNGYKSIDNDWLNQHRNIDGFQTAAFADVNNDGYPDLLYGQNDHLFLLLNQKGGSFKDITPSSGLKLTVGVYRSSYIQDIDNDGYLDVILYQYDGSTQIWYGSSTVFKKDSVIIYPKQSELESVLAWTDYDNDGFLDLLTVTPNFTRLYHNEGNVNRWLSVTLNGHKANTEGIGTRVIAYLKGSAQYREIGYNQSTLGYSPLLAHFGFGPPNCNASDIIDSVVIIWQPGGRQVLKDVRMNQFIVVDQDSGIVRSYQKPVSSGMGFVFPVGLATIHTNPNKKIDLPVSIYLPPGRGIDTLAVDEISFSINYDQSMLDISPTKVAQHYTPPPGWTYKSSYTGNDTLEVTIAHTPSVKLTGDSVYLGSFNFDTYLGKYASTLVYISGLSLVTDRRKFSFCTNLEGAVITRVIVDTIQSSGVISTTLKPEELHIIPNPASGDVRISWANNSEHLAAAIRVVDQLGREVYHSSGIESVVIPENTLASGSYIVEVALANKKLIGHLIIR
ncbi:MAG TPA: FG-GAP-like repeat-containing protein [Candidatus Kapabacteria bacterium]|nr:FG-GAP-like repeat-containing protein [Candidatus Kapabacteria bacterium]